MNDQEIRQEKYRRLTEQPVEKLVLHMAVPTIVSMLVSAFYNMVDTLFVGRLSTSATASVGVVFSFMALLQAVGFFFGHGSGNYISRALGKKDTEAASRMAATGFYAAILVGVLIAVCGLIWCGPMIRFLGATETMTEDTLAYFLPILAGAPFMTASLVLNNQLRLQGNAFFAMIGIAVGAVLNIALDPILIFACRMGVAGAAVATSAAQIVSFVILLIGSGKNGNIKIAWRKFSPSAGYDREIVKGGFPSLCIQGFASIAAILLNQAAGNFGDSAIAAFSVVNRITMFAGAALLGFGQGFQPVCGFNYSAGLYGRVKKAFWFCVKLTTVCLCVLCAAGLLLAPRIVSLFRSEDAELLKIASGALRYQAATFPFLGWIIMSNMMLQNIGEALKASVLALARQGLFFIPVILLLPIPFGLRGVQLAQPVSDMLTFGLSVPLTYSVLKKMRGTETGNDSAPSGPDET